MPLPSRRRRPAVKVAGRELVLTPTEHQLLLLLSSQPGRAFTRAELVARIMPDAIVLERTIDVHIKALRKKLGPQADLIETVRGVGYRFSSSPATEDAAATEG